jgi:hypothetical protein
LALFLMAAFKKADGGGANLIVSRWKAYKTKKTRRKARS